MQIPKIQKIDQQQIYPCPCRKRAKLQPITLTDAFGCDRCPLIFVVEDSGNSLVQLGGIDPHRRVWQWNGIKWLARREMTKYQIEVMPMQLLLLSVTLMLLLLLLSLNMELAMGLPLALIAVTPLVLVIWWWLLMRTRP